MVFIILVALIISIFLAKWAYKEWIKKGHARGVSIAGSISLGITFFILTIMISTSFSNKTESMPQQDENTTLLPSNSVENEIPSFIQQVKDYDKTSILDVRKHGENVLEIDLKATEVAFSDVGYLDIAGRTARDILIKIRKNNPNQKFDVIRFVIIARLKDQYNNISEDPIFQLTYDYPEIQKVNIDTDYVDHRLFMNFAKFSIRHPTGHDLYKAWCLKDNNAERSGNFCYSK